MTRTLAFKLVLAFLIVSVAGVVLAAVFARWATYQEFDRLLLNQAQETFVADAIAYYQTNGSWQDVDEYFRLRAPLPNRRPRPGQPPPQFPAGTPPDLLPTPYVFALINPDGYVLAPAGQYRPDERVDVGELAQGIAIEVDGQVVGIALATGDAPQLGAQEERYLARTNRTSLYAALAAILIALPLGALLARTLTRSLRELTVATQALAKGDLDQQVPIRSQDELGELAAAFNLMSADLAHSNELRRQMTADIAHDLRTPLTVMAGYLEALRDGVLEPSSDRFETMYQEAQHLKRLVEDLRTLSLADAGELTLNREPVSPQSLLKRAASAYRHQAEQQDVALQVDLALGLPNLDVDPDRMAQVLGNLIINALRHTPAGGEIFLGARQQGDAVLLTVQDTGEGIAPAHLPHVFDRFYRGDEARQAQEGESGLGLTIVRSLVELHGGTISVDSVLGAGAAFEIVLPVG